MEEKKRLFRELTDETANEIWLEEFSKIGETIMVGSNHISENYNMAISFFLAAKELEKIVLKHLGIHLFQYEYPMLFLYRHSLELFLKSNILGRNKSHNLNDLLEEFIKQTNESHNVDISNGWFAKSIREFSKIDPLGQSFRYPQKLTGGPTITGSFVFNVIEWCEKSTQICNVFVHLNIVNNKL